MSAEKKTARERIRTILAKPYVRVPLIVAALVASGFAVVYIFVLIAAVIVLANSIGNANAQLVVGMISALGTSSLARSLFTATIQSQSVGQVLLTLFCQ